MTEWEPWFAWYPVEVDAYDVSEIKNGKMRYTVYFRWVKRLYVQSFDEGGELIPGHWKYKL
jgi:hypothetical protein